MTQGIHRLSIIASTIGLFLIAVVLFLLFGLFGAPAGDGDQERFVVPLESDSGATIEGLYSRGFIKNETGFRLALRLKGKNPSDIKPGAYNISKSMNAWDVADVLAGEPYMKWIVIPEGYRKEQIAALMRENVRWSDEDAQDFISESTSDLAAIPEGVFFPDTYLIPVGETPQAVADRLYARFNDVFSPYAQEALEQNIRWPTLLNIAALVQREAAGKEDMPLIAGILWNRLLDERRLEIDATVQYIIGEEGNWWPQITPDDIQIDSPFNTYKNAGLPPHPIANPGASAIEAVLYPGETECFFYIHDNEGNIHCAETFEEHEANIERYLR